MADAERTAQTAEASTVHKPLGKPGGPGLWHHKNLQLPAYIQSVAQHLRASGHDESKAVEMAVGIIKNWAAGHDGHGNHVHPDVQAAAVKAVAEWEKLRAEAHSTKARRSIVTGASRAEMTAQSINDLPDSAFAYIEPGGKKDADGKTTPRSLRHFPVHDAAHVRNALARAPQSPFGDKAMGKIKAAAKKFGIGDNSGSSGDGGGSSGGSASRSAPGDLLRFYPLEDIHILTRAEGDASGTLVEAYATVFDEPAEIHDHQGHYMEVIDRGAFDQVLARIRAHGSFASAVKVLYNHGKTMEGQPAPEYQIPIGVPEDIRPEKRGLLTRTRYDADDPFAERILSKVRSGAITAQSFVGGIVRSSPELRGPGDRFRRRNGELISVRRMVLGLREYGPVLFPAYSGAEILGVRMQLPGDPADEAAPDYAQDEEFAPDMEGDGAGGIPEEVHPSRYHKHRLYQMQTEPLLRKAGIVLPGRD